MMPLCKAITKQLLGARYEGAVRALASAGVLHLAVRASGWQVTVAPAVLCLSTAWYTAGVLLQQLQGRRLQDTVAALLAMPCRQRLAPVYTLTVGGCTLLTRTLPVWALFAAVWLLRRRQPWAALLGAAGLAVPLAGHTGVVLGLALAVTAAALAVQCAALLWLTGRQKN